jgi:hypothetical protein
MQPVQVLGSGGADLASRRPAPKRGNRAEHWEVFFFQVVRVLKGEPLEDFVETPERIRIGRLEIET